MPIYDYRCNCGEVTEARRGVGFTSIPCPACGRTAAREAVYSIVSRATISPNYPDSICPGDIKNKHGQYRVKLWQERAAEAAYREEMS
ncbi:hypothetical protein LCGC14_2321630 [marine sediment metagenome]|uniref:Putative regulatory protein FmdB zinc ribbon domain-containing protein n=1 Tax=marine sediment metagenome TaxID=412755 RepID=A0A0F9CI81_9ZZZZ